MAQYRVRFKPQADRQLRKLARPVQKRLAAAIDMLAADPRPPGVKRLADAVDLWRIRVGNYRIVYTIEDDVLVVLVVKLGHRRNVYLGM